MAQQTRIETVAGYYARFIDRFPSVSKLAEAGLDDVLKLWEGMGYYARARNLHAAARHITRHHAGRLPASVGGLRTLAGVGPYTAGAIASIAFGIAEPAIDGNARRVLSRLFDLETASPEDLDRAARTLLAEAPDRPGAVNQAIMDLGGSVCTPRHPDCECCPLMSDCRARTRDTVAKRPPPRRRAPVPSRYAASAIVRREGRVFLVRRPLDGLLGGLWDFPGVAPSAEPIGRDALRDGIVRDWGLLSEVGECAGSVVHAFSHFRLTLAVYEAAWRSGEPPPNVEARWCSPEDFESVAFPAYLQTFLEVC